jgi:hypothetical protein
LDDVVWPEHLLDGVAVALAGRVNAVLGWVAREALHDRVRDRDRLKRLRAVGGRERDVPGRVVVLVGLSVCS